MAELCTMLLVQLELPGVAASLCHATDQGLLVAPESKEGCLPAYKAGCRVAKRAEMEGGEAVGQNCRERGPLSY